VESRSASGLSDGAGSLGVRMVMDLFLGQFAVYLVRTVTRSIVSDHEDAQSPWQAAGPSYPGGDTACQ
jgi:hypothetical protein